MRVLPRTPRARRTHLALIDQDSSLGYAALDAEVASESLVRSRVSVYAPVNAWRVIAIKRVATVSCLLGTMRLGAIAVPINPQLMPGQIAHILVDCGARVLVDTGAQR